ncbi:YihY family inner membrane protein [Campylobacter sp. JMF_07 ED4]|uniref:YihY family inner membrane protein n=1 Tax=Campylobacter sp. JMF_07 ED4 TaxID=2983840 RepID=UPI0022E9E6B2|nr:YihY family inner membrane protein [Campylobacter sp. JMF_07 ED4]MDA3044330.1 YihY family inner membrane protein [Campylobacter sp. JMF_07 ED4]
MKNLKIFLDEFKIFIKSWRKIYDPHLMHYASSLSFHTILAFLPVLMVSLSVFMQLPSFHDYYAKIKAFIFSNLLPANQESLIPYLEEFMANGLSLGALGFLAVLVTSILFFDDFEEIIAQISHSPKRGFFKGLSTYWTLMTLAPVGLGASFFISSELQNLLDKTEFSRWINLLSVLPFVIIWAIFAITYATAINREIRPKAVLISSLVASTLWWISKIIFAQYVFYNKTYLSIYGSFSVALFFFLWIYISWIFYLNGVKFCVYLDNCFKNLKRN